MKVAIAGYGLEGEQNYSYWNTDGNDVTIHDEKESPSFPIPADAKTVLGPNAYDHLEEYDIVIRTAGLPPRKLSSAKKIWSATNEFFEKCPAPIIGVTGTKGKGTTSSLITSILDAAGKKVHLVGNIGTPALAELSKISADDIVVYELSSFQLWDAEKSPHVAVVLMIEPDHLDVHESMDEYVNAKLNIMRFQSEDDMVIMHHSLGSVLDLPRTAAAVVPYPDTATVHVQDGWFVVKGRKLVETSAMSIPGAHNLDNACAAIIATGYLLSSEYDDTMVSILRRGLSAFEGLPHRLRFVAEKNGVSYYDDSIATTPGSAIAALASFEEPKMIIIGGHDKGADYTELIESCQRTNSTVLAVGANGPRIADMCREAGVAYVEEPGDMDAIVVRAAQTAQEGSVVILSPAAASFDMFKSYSDRGDQFIAAVEAL